jgi:hypothetical protein
MGTAFAIDEAIDCGHAGNALKMGIVKLHMSSSYPNSDGAIANNGEALGTALAATSLGCEYVHGIELISTGVIGAIGYVFYGTSGGGTWVAGRGYPVATYKLAAAYGDYSASSDGAHVTVANAVDLSAVGAALVFKVLYS